MKLLLIAIALALIAIYWAVFMVEMYLIIKQL